MKIKIDEAKKIATQALVNNGFDKEVAEGCVRNIIEGELVGKKSHGIIRVLHQVIRKEKEIVSTKKTGLQKLRETSRNFYLDAHHLPGFYAIYESLTISIPAAKKNKLFTVGIKNCDITGYIGDYARIATENDLIYIGFHNSQGGLVPYGARVDSWGTNPVTVGIPTNSLPIIYDSASTQMTWGELMLARKANKKLNLNVAVDANGEVTIDPNKAEALLPFFGHKGSGQAMIVEMLGGGLTGSGIGKNIKGGWGSFYILIDPTLFRSLKDFKKDIDIAIAELKSLPKADGVKEIFYPGEQSGKLREKHLREGWIDIDERLWEEISSLL